MKLLLHPSLSGADLLAMTPSQRGSAPPSFSCCLPSRPSASPRRASKLSEKCGPVVADPRSTQEEMPTSLWSREARQACRGLERAATQELKLQTTRSVDVRRPVTLVMRDVVVGLPAIPEDRRGQVSPLTATPCCPPSRPRLNHIHMNLITPFWAIRPLFWVGFVFIQSSTTVHPQCMDVATGLMKKYMC